MIIITLPNRNPKDIDKDHIGYTEIQYMYARSFFNKEYEIASKNKEAFNYFKGQAQKYWTSRNKYLQGMMALALYRYNDTKTPDDIIKSLKENALYSDEWVCTGAKCMAVITGIRLLLRAWLC